VRQGAKQDKAGGNKLSYPVLKVGKEPRNIFKGGKGLEQDFEIRLYSK
jgi:hypothetical protein